MRRAESLVREAEWTSAIPAYNEALSEYPEDLVALTGLGLAYIETDQPAKALSAYRRAASLAPNNPKVIVSLAQALVRLGRWSEAAGIYVQAADACIGLREYAAALDLLQKAALMDPQNLSAHQGLADVYQRQGETRKAAWQHLISARVLERRAQRVRAVKECAVAQRLDPHNPEAAVLLAALKRGDELPHGPTARLQPEVEGRRTLESFVVFQDIELETASMLSDWGRSSPADLAREHALAEMAEAAFSDDADPRLARGKLLLAQGADFQARGMEDRAISAYREAVRRGSETPTVHFLLGLLYREKKEYARAIEHLGRGLGEPNLALGARFAIGEAYYAWDKIAVALEHLLEALHLIDAHTVHASQKGDLSLAYARIRQDYVSQGASADVRRFAQSVLSFLCKRGWGERVIEVRKQLNSLAAGGILVTLAETLVEPRAEMVTTALSQIQEYMERSLYFTALEECYWAIHQTPYFLPLHLYMADVLIAKGQTEAAVGKYVMTAQTYQSRSEIDRAIAVYRRALDIAPMEVGVRQVLIDLMLDQRQIDQAMEQYLHLAEVYYQLAQVDTALSKLDEALIYANQGDPARQWPSQVLHRAGDIYAQRLDWRQAIRAYRRIKNVNARDAQARSALVDLYFKSGQRELAFQELDALLDLHKAQGRPRQRVETLQDALRSRPDDLDLHMRLARVHHDLGDRKGAIAELDAIAQLQVGMDQTQAAQRTIMAIIRLGPDNVDGYQQLLSQLQRR
jgi:tetratricopeptide (TPR) repeat protein